MNKVEEWISWEEKTYMWLACTKKKYIEQWASNEFAQKVRFWKSLNETGWEDSQFENDSSIAF